MNSITSNNSLHLDSSFHDNSSLHFNGSVESDVTGDSDVRVDTDVTAPSSALPGLVWVGFTIAVFSNFLDGSSIILKKQSLKKMQARGLTRASEGGYGYLKEQRWWLGLLVLALGELLKFVAYLLAPAILITPLGVLAIVFNAILSPYFLNEKLGSLGKLGCFLVIIGCVIVSICGPKDHEIASLEALDDQLSSAAFITYFVVIVVISLVFMYFGPKYGDKNVFYYSVIITGLASLSVMVCKGIGVGIVEGIRGLPFYRNWSFWVCCVILIIALVVETIYAQKLLDLFHATLAMSAMYVLINPLIIIVSIVVFGAEVDVKDVVLTILGVMVNIVAVYILNMDNDTTDNSTTDEKQDKKDNNNQASPERLKDSDMINYKGSLPSTPMLSMPNLPNLPPVGFGEGQKSSSCLSLLSGATMNLSSNNLNAMGSADETIECAVQKKVEYGKESPRRDCHTEEINVDNERVEE